MDQAFYIEDCVKGCQDRIVDGSIDLVFADPPFNIGFGDGHSRSYHYGVSRREEIYYSDDMLKDDYIARCGVWIKEAWRILRENGIFIIMSSWNHVSAIEMKANEIGFATLNHLIWRYEFGVFTIHRFTTSHYTFLILLKGDPSKNAWTFNKKKPQEEDVEREIQLFLDELDPDERKINIEKIATKMEEILYTKRKNYIASDFFDDLRRLSRRYAGVDHPCKLSEDVLIRFYEIFTNEGDKIVDLFMGSGTSLVAAVLTRRKYVGFEIKKDYLSEINKLVKKRLESKRNVKKISSL